MTYTWCILVGIFFLYLLFEYTESLYNKICGLLSFTPVFNRYGIFELFDQSVSVYWNNVRYRIIANIAICVSTRRGKIRIFLIFSSYNCSTRQMNFIIKFTTATMKINKSSNCAIILEFLHWKKFHTLIFRVSTLTVPYSSLC